MDFGTLFSLIVQAKKKGKGHLGNGRIYVMLMQTAADRECANVSGELDILRKFGNSTSAPDSYQRMDKYLNRLMKTNGQYPSSLFAFTKSETDWSIAISKMRQYIDKVIDDKKLSQLIFTLLEAVKHDENVGRLRYGNRIISKSEILGTFARPKKICAEGFLLGLLIYTHQNTDTFTSENLLEIGERTVFRVCRYVDASSLDTTIETSIEKNLSVNSELDRKSKIIRINKYPIETDKPTTGGNLFIYGAGGIGKSTYLWDISNGVKLFIPLCMYKWSERGGILEYILLRYHYQMDYRNIESCMVCEGRDTVSSQLVELERLLTDRSANSEQKYVLLLDGWNETDHKSQEKLTEELRYIADNWHNVHIIVSGRYVPRLDIFSEYEKIQLLGIPDNKVSALTQNRNILLSDKILQMLKLPIFINMFLESNVNALTRGEMLDNNLFMSEKSRNIKGFLVKFALPFVAKFMTDRRIFSITRADISDLADTVFDAFIDNGRIFQNYIAPLGYNKKSMLESRDNDDIVDIICYETGCLATENGCIFSFIHQYYRDYFAVRYIINFAEAMSVAYELGEVYEAENLLKKSALDFRWFTDDECYKLMGEICGDQRNIASEDMRYTRTLLDDILDMARYFHGSRIAENVIDVMKFSRRKRICGVDFGGLTLPMSISPNIKFSLDGDIPCRFCGCKVLDLGVFSSKIYGSAYSEDKKMLCICFADGYTILYNLAEHRLLFELDLSEYTEFALEFEIVIFKDERTVELISCKSHLEINIESRAVTVISHSDGMANIPEYYDNIEVATTSSISKETLFEIYSHLDQFRGCNFRDAEFLDKKMEEISHINGIEL